MESDHALASTVHRGFDGEPLHTSPENAWAVHVPVREPKNQAHGVISRDVMLPRSRRKKNRRSVGLPGKLPVNRQVTTIMPSCCSSANGSQAYVNLAEVAAFHCLIDDRPLWI